MRFQIKIDGQAVENDIEVVKKVWACVGTGMRFVVDGNRGLTTKDALRLSHECRISHLFLSNSLEEITSMPTASSSVFIDESATDISIVIRVWHCRWFRRKFAHWWIATDGLFSGICEAKTAYLRRCLGI